MEDTVTSVTLNVPAYYLRPRHGVDSNRLLAAIEAVHQEHPQARIILRREKKDEDPLIHRMKAGSKTIGDPNRVQKLNAIVLAAIQSVDPDGRLTAQIVANLKEEWHNQS